MTETEMIAQSARLLRCYVLIDLKRDKLTHQYLGQRQMYMSMRNGGRIARRTDQG